MSKTTYHDPKLVLSLDWVSRWLRLTEPEAEVLFDPGAWLDPADHCSEASSFPGGKEENTGSASKLSDRLTMGSVEVTSIEPVKLVSPNRDIIPCASWPPGNSVRTTLASTSPAVSLAVKVTGTDMLAEGFA